MHKNTTCAYFYIILLKIGYSKYLKIKSVYNKLKGDGIIKVILKFIGAGYMDKYQVKVKIYKNNKEIINSRTFNGEVCLILEKNDDSIRNNSVPMSPNASPYLFIEGYLEKKGRILFSFSATAHSSIST